MWRWRIPNPFDPGYYETEELRTFGFARVGDDVRIARNCTIIGPENIELGDHVRIDAYTSLLCRTGSIRLGSHIHLCTSVMLGGRGGIELGDYSCLSSGARIFSASDLFDGEWMASCNVPAEYTQPKIAPVRGGRHLAIGTNSVVMPGVTIGEGAAVCPLTYVARDLDSWTIYAGIPARRVRDRRRGILNLESQLAAAALAN